MTNGVDPDQMEFKLWKISLLHWYVNIMKFLIRTTKFWDLIFSEGFISLYPVWWDDRYQISCEFLDDGLYVRV